MKLKESINKLHRGKDVRENLYEYLGKSMHLYGENAKVKLILEYFLFYEMSVDDDIQWCVDAIKTEAEEVNAIIMEYTGKNAGDDMSGLKASLIRMRDAIKKKMDVLSAYVDRFMIHEYVLNRVQYRFDDMDFVPDDDVFTKDVLQFIVGSQDETVLSDKLHFVVGQLPVRMARSHYFDIIKQSISLYKGDEKSSIEGFIYFFKTTATLYQTEEMDEYFTEFKMVLDEFDAVDYDNITKEVYETAEGKLIESTSKLKGIGDLYMLLCEIVNDMCIILDAAKFGEGETEVETEVLRGVNDLFMGNESDIWQGDMKGASDEEKFSWLSERLTAAEGFQEKIMGEVGKAEAALEEITVTYREDIEELGLEEGFVSFVNAMQLNSGSTFAEVFDEKERLLDVIEKSFAHESDETDKTGKDILTDDELQKITADLILEMKEKLSNSGRMVRRAIMARTLEDLPMFLTGYQEISDYISSSLSGCDDAAEKYVAKQLIIDEMSEWGGMPDWDEMSFD